MLPSFDGASPKGAPLVRSSRRMDTVTARCRSRGRPLPGGRRGYWSRRCPKELHCGKRVSRRPRFSCSVRLPPMKSLTSSRRTLSQRSTKVHRFRPLARLPIRRSKTPYPVHIKVDTGLNRFGVAEERAGGFVRRVCADPRVRVDGLSTHFATGDVVADPFLDEQRGRFDAVISAPDGRWFPPAYYSCGELRRDIAGCRVSGHGAGWHRHVRHSSLARLSDAARH